MLQLESFEIKGLNQEQNIFIEFQDNKKIIVAENGSGKTTILNILYHCLNNNIGKLRKYDFNKCILKFSDKEPIIFNKPKGAIGVSTYSIFTKNLNEISLFLNLLNQFLDKFSYKMTEKIIIEVINEFYNSNHEYQINNNSREIDSFIFNRTTVSLSKENNYLIREVLCISPEKFLVIRNIIGRLANNSSRIYEKIRIELSQLIDYNIPIDHLIALAHSILLSLKISSIKKKFDLDLKIIYLPTYRRIEHESEELFGNSPFNEDDYSSSLVNFGINDVKSIIENLTEKLRSFSVEKFNQINGRALNDLISNDYKFNDEAFTKINNEYLDIILSRIGKEITENNKIKVKKVVLSDSINNQQNKFLKQLIVNLSEIYEKQLIVDSIIKNYIRVCNKYLQGKQIIYDESQITIGIFKVNKNNKKFKEINFSALSSGEKQIIALFAKLYLSDLEEIDLNDIEKNNWSYINDIGKYWILFDEPELSLSVEWQEMLLPDLIESKRCDFLFATTHSPFIFNNNLKYYTTDIRSCIEEIEING